jgi:crossover junction endodeoxyribonuclease RuvC
MFNFGMSYGIARGVLGALGVPVLFITPQEWRRSYRLPAHKDAGRIAASRLFPSYSQHFTRMMDHGRADAALLALFGSRQPI